MLPEFSERAQAVKDRIRCDAVVGRYTDIRAGRANCPLHGGSNRSAMVVNGQRFHCFSCGASGDAIDFLAEAEGVRLGDALRMLEADVGIDVQAAMQDVAALAHRNQALHEKWEGIGKLEKWLDQARPRAEYLTNAYVAAASGGDMLDGNRQAKKLCEIHDEAAELVRELYLKYRGGKVLMRCNAAEHEFFNRAVEIREMTRTTDLVTGITREVHEAESCPLPTPPGVKPRQGSGR